MIGLTLKGDHELVSALLELPKAVFNRVMVSAVTKAAKPVIAQARQVVAVESGALKKSLGAIVKKYPSKGTVVAVIGARGGFDSAGENGKRNNPANYSHLVELGHKIVRSRSLAVFRTRYMEYRPKAGTGATIGRVAPRPFLQPSLASRMHVVADDLRASIGAGIEREAQRAVRSAERWATPGSWFA